MNSNAVILFTRVPEAGKTKTRMMPYLSPEECVALHESFLRDIIREAALASADLRVYATPRVDDPSFRALFPEGTSFFLQEGPDLGARMEAALEETLKAGYRAAVLVGTDLPELRKEDFQCAFRVLEQRDVVLGPTRDGGYWLLGLSKPSHAPFEPKTYGTSSVYENTLAGIEAAGLSVGTVRELEDMDEREDLAAFRERIRRNPALLNTESGRYVTDHAKISVIVPSYNEEKVLPTLLQQLDRFRQPGNPFQGQLEFLFADGGSTDGTLELLRAGNWPVLSAPKGRANQMNAAAKEAKGDILFFLHCDSEVPKDFPREILEVMKRHEAGCFGIAYRTKESAMHI
ncbi:MAG: TIGR04282 family arsenosugar biosynthesis glycosyltransferase, partial [Clostridia bacterium]|nr:TIGR04282 family arsenosugar biosynthesis glycosyltransferase [Clostridia bacterium]